MARIRTVTLEQLHAPQRQLAEQVKGVYGVFPGIAQVLFVDPDTAGPTFQIYQHLNLRPTSPLTKVQREMVATVVNGLIGGTP